MDDYLHKKTKVMFELDSHSGYLFVAHLIALSSGTCSQ